MENRDLGELQFAKCLRLSIDFLSYSESLGRPRKGKFGISCGIWMDEGNGFAYIPFTSLCSKSKVFGLKRIASTHHEKSRAQNALYYKGSPVLLAFLLPDNTRPLRVRGGWAVSPWLLSISQERFQRCDRQWCWSKASELIKEPKQTNILKIHLA